MDNKKMLKEQYKSRTVTGGVFCIRCEGNGRAWLKAAQNLEGQKSRFQFAVDHDSCLEPSMRGEWKQYGASSFTFTVLEELEKKPDQSDAEFARDIKTLLEMWQEKDAAQ